VEAFRQRLQQEASSRLEPYSREVFLSVGIKDSNKLLVRPLQFSLIDSYPVMSAKKCARQAEDGSWISLIKSKAVHHQRKPAEPEEKQIPPTYVDIFAKGEFCEKARLLPFEASVFKKHMLQGKDIPQFYVDLFRKEEACGGPKMTDAITYVGLSGVLDIDELMFNRDVYHLTFGVDPMEFYISRPLETRIKMSAVFPSSPGLLISDYNFEASCPPPATGKYKSYLPEVIEGGSKGSIAYPVLIADDFFQELELHKYHPSNEEFRETSGYRREFDWSKNPDYNRNLKQYMLTRASERLQKPTAGIGNQAKTAAQNKSIGSTLGHSRNNNTKPGGLLAKLRSSSESTNTSSSASPSAPPIDVDEVNRDFSESMSDFASDQSVFFAPPEDDLPPPDPSEFERRSVMGLSELKREGRSFSSAAKEMGVEKTAPSKPWLKEKKPLPVFSASVTKTPKTSSAPSWAQQRNLDPGKSGLDASGPKAPDQAQERAKESNSTAPNKKPSLLGRLQGSRETGPATPTSSMSI